jgi:hypothetical protein
MRMIDALVPRWVLYVAGIVLGLGFVRGGGLASTVNQLNVAAHSLVAPLEALAATAGLVGLVVGVILHYATPHKRLHGHGREMIGAALVGTVILGAGIAVIPHAPDLGARLGNAAYQALVGAIQ